MTFKLPHEYIIQEQQVQIIINKNNSTSLDGKKLKMNESIIESARKKCYLKKKSHKNRSKNMIRDVKKMFKNQFQTQFYFGNNI